MTNPAEEVSDGTLVARARRGDAAAFRELVRRHYRAAYALALGQLGNGMDAEDACQDAFVRALERLEECRNPDRFVAWLLAIVRNRAHNLRDARNIRSALPLQAGEARGNEASGEIGSDRFEAPEVGAERAELRSALETALGNLAPLRRQVVLLHDLEGYRHREVAELLGISTGMSRQHLMHARRQLRAALRDRRTEEYLNA